MGLWYGAIWELPADQFGPGDRALLRRCDSVAGGAIRPYGRLVMSALFDNSEDPSVVITHRAHNHERGER